MITAEWWCDRGMCGKDSEERGSTPQVIGSPRICEGSEALQRLARKSLGITALVLGSVALLWVWSGSTSELALRHKLQSRLKPLSAVGTLH